MPSIMTGRTCQPNAAALEATRERLALSKSELCRRLGIRPSTYGGYLHGAAMPAAVRDSIRGMCCNGAPDIWDAPEPHPPGFGPVTLCTPRHRLQRVSYPPNKRPCEAVRKKETYERG